jgi:hypothetical protein
MIEGSQPTIFGTPSNAVATGPAGQLGMGASYRVANGGDHAGAFLKQAFVRFKNVGAKGNMARLGRIEFVDGAESVPSDSTVAWLKRERIAHRVLANFAFSAAQRSYDAVHLARSTSGYNVTLMAGMPTEGVFQLDGEGTLTDIRVGYGAVTVPFELRCPSSVSGTSLLVFGTSSIAANFCGSLSYTKRASVSPTSIWNGIAIHATVNGISNPSRWYRSRRPRSIATA